MPSGSQHLLQARARASTGERGKTPFEVEPGFSHYQSRSKRLGTTLQTIPFGLNGLPGLGFTGERLGQLLRVATSPTSTPFRFAPAL